MTRICKDQLVARVSDTTKIAQTDVKSIIDATMEEIRRAMARNDEVMLKDFGLFKTQTMAAKTGHDINTGKPIQIPERKKVKFMPGKKLTNTVK